MSVEEQRHYCYILYNIHNPQRTYVGYTTNPPRRLRQHNGLLSGGAKATTRLAKGSWSFLALISSPSFNTNTGLSFEWHLKRALRTRHNKIVGGPIKRLEALFHTIKTNSKFHGFDFHIYMSQYAQHIIPEYLIEDLSHPHIVLYDTMADILILDD